MAARDSQGRGTHAPGSDAPNMHPGPGKWCCCREKKNYNVTISFPARARPSHALLGGGMPPKGAGAVAKAPADRKPNALGAWFKGQVDKLKESTERSNAKTRERFRKFGALISGRGSGGGSDSTHCAYRFGYVGARVVIASASVLPRDLWHDTGARPAQPTQHLDTRGSSQPRLR